MGEMVRITDVSPRDGLQNEPLRAGDAPIPTAEKARLITALVASAVDEVEVTSFVSPRWVPQLGDAPELCDAIAHLRGPSGGAVFSALVPNAKGMEGALAANARSLESHGRRVIDRVAVFTAASETFSKRNTNATIAETIERFREVVAMAREAGIGVRGYVSCAIACPFEGAIAPGRVADVAARLSELGIDEIDLGDTIGVGTPDTTRAMLEAVMRTINAQATRITLHLHDTFGHAADCTRTALDVGVRSFDGAAGGLGGCPYASTPERRAPGNIDAELLVRTIEAAGYRTGVDLTRLRDAARIARGLATSPSSDDASRAARTDASK
ncbi:MAG: hydroxymethylglutaryl-CoA lyase [Phycisphaerales bacterium]|jgi:hydroxymethylglutaryl-CoA lyase|nr:hydroxymethylglutaryl-CoA lyase [Phycisphaerales bacterium]